MRPRFRIVDDADPTERVFGSAQFIARDRNPALPSPPRKFVPTKKREGDIVI